MPKRRAFFMPWALLLFILLLEMLFILNVYYVLLTIAVFPGVGIRFHLTACHYLLMVVIVFIGTIMFLLTNLRCILPVACTNL